MVKLLVIADDFTGALDTGVQFSKKGVQTLVSTDVEYDFGLEDKDIEVVVLDIESRHILPEQAAEKVENVIKNAVRYGVKHIYKKTDSTLRGNIGSELFAALTACNSKELMFIPAFPKTGRITVDGHQYVDGKPLDKTSFAHDPFEPIRFSEVSKIIKAQSDVKTILVKKDEPIIGDDEQSIYIFDAQTDDDLKLIGQRLKDINKLQVLAGCAGFAEFLPELLDLTTNRNAEIKYKKDTPVISGSVNRISIEQIRYAEKNGYKSIALTPQQKLDKDYYNSLEGQRFVKEIIEDIDSDSRFIIKVISDRSEMAESDKYAEMLGISFEDIRHTIAQNIGELVKHILKQKRLDAFIVFGGDTVLAIMEALECNGIIPIDEIVPGVVISKVVSDNFNFKIITKAGGFGGEDILMKIREIGEN